MSRMLFQCRQKSSSAWRESPMGQSSVIGRTLAEDVAVFIGGIRCRGSPESLMVLMLG